MQVTPGNSSRSARPSPKIEILRFLEAAREAIPGLPVLGPVLALFKSTIDKVGFTTSRHYWERRYQRGGNSGRGSYGMWAEFKAEVINTFLAENRVTSVIEYGCGDGNQVRLIDYPDYLGFDVSKKAVEICREIFRTDDTKQFKLMEEYADETAELTVSLDVIFHLVEDNVFETYMNRLFDSSTRFVVVYSDDSEEVVFGEGPHIRHRKFTKWVSENKPDWTLIRHVPNRCPRASRGYRGAIPEFYFYAKA